MEPLLTKENFKCDRYCGECCKKLLVVLSNKDIKNIEKLGYHENPPEVSYSTLKGGVWSDTSFNRRIFRMPKMLHPAPKGVGFRIFVHKKDDFIMQDIFDPKRKFLKKQENGWCVFLKKENDGRYTCKIHKNRPEVCRKYPFFPESPKEIKSCLPEDLYPNVFFKLPSRNNQ